MEKMTDGPTAIGERVEIEPCRRLIWRLKRRVDDTYAPSLLASPRYSTTNCNAMAASTSHSTTARHVVVIRTTSRHSKLADCSAASISQDPSSTHWHSSGRGREVNCQNFGLLSKNFLVGKFTSKHAAFGAKTIFKKFGVKIAIVSTHNFLCRKCALFVVTGYLTGDITREKKQ